MKSITIEKGVPIFDRHKTKLHKLMRKMKVGDSFVWDRNNTPHRAAKDYGFQITTRSIKGEGYRVWRVK